MRLFINIWVLAIFVIFGILGGFVYTRYAQPVNEVQVPVQEVLTEQTFRPIPSEEPEIDVTKPKTLTVPKINIQAAVEEVGVDSEGKMDVPKGVYNVGWFNLGFKPGEKGSAVLAGHLDTVTGAPAVFYYLEQMAVGDQVIMTDENGKNLTFEVTRIVSYPFDRVPLEEIFGSSDKPRVNLITCVGTWDVGTRNYSERLVVYTELKS